jgi:uncharacterized membrane protein
MARHPRWVRRVFSDGDLEALHTAIARTEAQTSAELRVHLEHRLPGALQGDALIRARQVFAHLGMHRTAGRNGVLIYLALADRRLAIVGDDAIHERVGDGYWAAVRDHLVDGLRQRHVLRSLLDAIAEVGQALREHFPREPGGRNELSDDVSLS